MNHHNEIFLATKSRCIDEQDAAYAAAWSAMRYRDEGLLGRAAKEQDEAAYFYKEAWMRLERLLGIA